MKLVLRGYSRTRPIMKKGKHMGNRPIKPPEGCFDLHKPCFAICGNKIELWLIVE